MRRREGLTKKHREERLGKVNINSNGESMKVIDYIDSRNIVVEFQDKEKVNTTWIKFKNGKVRNPHVSDRLWKIKLNNQGCPMKIIEYINYKDMTIMFLDDYRYTVKTTWDTFEKGSVWNPYWKTLYGVAAIGSKYPNKIEGKITKESDVWRGIIKRCFSKDKEEKIPAYKDVTCCDEWLLFENFYEWIHSQENFDKWLHGDGWAIDKDILVKGNKVYSPETCCLVPKNVNNLFIKQKAARGDLPIGVYKHHKKEGMFSTNYIYGKKINRAKTTTASYPTPEDAFYFGYKPAKEDYIKRVAQEEYKKGNITEKCYNAMMNYQVEITD